MSVSYRTAQKFAAIEAFTVPCAVEAQEQPVRTVQQVEKLAYCSGVFSRVRDVVSLPENCATVLIMV